MNYLMHEHEGQNRQPFGERHADESSIVKTLPNVPGLRPMAMARAGGGNADADGRATEGETDVNVTGQYLRASYVFSFVGFSFSPPFAERSPGGKVK